MATSNGTRARRRRLLTGAALLAVMTAPACTRIDNALASVPVFMFMRNTPSFDPYANPLPPAPGSVPFESPSGPALPPLAATQQALEAWAAGPWGQNPYAADDAVVLATGQVMYERHCAVCHGVGGGGDGPLVGPTLFPLMPSLIAAPATGLSDGYVYAVIRAGRGLMPAYGTRITHDERWAIVTYVNSLQAQAGVQQPAPAQDAAAAGSVAAPAQQPPAQPDTMSGAQ
ncbi:MAG TPA: cytochrome c [Longimicrobiales bacterium]|nr:cytochrome c [Longimicrobiales bacterium]